MWPQPKLDEAGSGTSGSAPAATKPAESATPAQPSQPPTQPEASQQPTPGTTPEGFVPIDQLRAVTAERDSLKRATDEAERKKAEDEGRWQELAEKNAAQAKEERARFEATARRAAFVAAISGKASDPMAAFKLAHSDGLLSDVKVSDDGEADEKPITEAIDATLKKYPMLKAGAGSFGGERGGTQSETTGVDVAKMSSRERMEYGIAQEAKSTPHRR